MRTHAALLSLALAGSLSLGCGAPPASGDDDSIASEQGASVLAACDEASILAATPPSRLPVIQRALAWVHAGVMYSQSSYYQGYRQDCSGFTSMAWQLGTSRVTWQLAPFDTDISHVIDASQLVPGDALNRDVSDTSEQHIMIFGGWLDASHEHVCVLQENHTGTPANITAYDKSWWGEFLPIRYDALDDVEDGSDPNDPEPLPAYEGLARDASGEGYWLVGKDGGVFTYGDGTFYGSMGGQKLNAPVVGMAATPSGHGYWLVGTDGGLFSFGDAGFYGSMGGKPLNQPIVGVAATPSGHGYWMVAKDGGVFSFGDAGFYGSMGGKSLNAPVVGMAATPSGHGYWMVAKDGGVFSFGDAGFYGSMGGKPLNAPVVGMAATPSGHGYWLVAKDGGVFSFGDAGFYGSMGGKSLNAPVVGIAATPSGAGYWIVGGDGGVFTFGDAGFFGSRG